MQSADGHQMSILPKEKQGQKVLYLATNPSIEIQVGQKSQDS